MSGNTEITAVLFDWDFTIAYVLDGATSGERITAIFQREGLAYTLDDIQTAMQSYQADMKEGKIRERRNAQTRQAIIYYYQDLLMRLGYEDRSWEFGNRLYTAYTALPTTLYDDSLPTLRVLHRQGFTLGIVSNHAITARRMIEKGVGELIPAHHITISEEIGVYKPAKTIFRRAAARIRTPPEHCLFVGDNLDVDAIAAVQQGRYALGLWLDRQKIGVAQELPHRVARITSLYEVLEHV